MLSLAPEFNNVKESNKKTYDEKVRALQAESNRSITWIHLLNYQSKLQRINSMRNLNTLRNGRNCNKFSDLYTIGHTPTIKSTHFMTARLTGLNTFMQRHLPIYKSECQAPLPVSEFFKTYSKSLSTFKQSIINSKLVSEHVTVFGQNLATTLTNASLFESENQAAEYTSVDQPQQKKTTPMEWSYLQQYPTNFNYMDARSLKLSDMKNSELIVEYLISFNWYKALSVSDKNSSNDDDRLIAIIASKELSASGKLKFKFLSAEMVHEVHST